MGADLISYSVVLPQGKKGILFVEKELEKVAKAPISEFSLGCYAEDLGLDDLTPKSEEAREEFKRDLERVRGFVNDFTSRDLGWQDEVIGGKKVTFYWAGEMSWGDTPEGAGYEALRAIWRLGIAKAAQKKLK